MSKIVSLCAQCLFSCICIRVCTRVCGWYLQTYIRVFMYYYRGVRTCVCTYYIYI